MTINSKISKGWTELCTEADSRNSEKLSALTNEKIDNSHFFSLHPFT